MSGVWCMCTPHPMLNCIFIFTVTKRKLRRLMHNHRQHTQYEDTETKLHQGWCNETSFCVSFCYVTFRASSVYIQLHITRHVIEPQNKLGHHYMDGDSLFTFRKLNIIISWGQQLHKHAWKYIQDLNIAQFIQSHTITNSVFFTHSPIIFMPLNNNQNYGFTIIQNRSLRMFKWWWPELAMYFLVVNIMSSSFV